MSVPSALAPETLPRDADVMNGALGTHLRIGGAPESRFGRWSVVLAGVAVGGLFLSALGFATGVLEAASSFSDNWLLTGWGVAVLGNGVASFVAGAFAIIRHHERSWAVLVATGIGLLVAAMMLNEVAQGL
jgi:ABC-type thiamin/hydroxymethylpyrimidine transport system permease subunit